MNQLNLRNNRLKFETARKLPIILEELYRIYPNLIKENRRISTRVLHWVPMPTYAHGFWVGMGAMLLFMGGHGWPWLGIGFVYPCIQLQIGVKLLGCREYANQEALRAEANDSERPFICPIQPRLGVGG
jgi:hypothetical protein